MEIKKVTLVHFSPSGTTRKTARILSESFGLPVEEANLLRDPSASRSFDPDELVIFCLPVYAGRLPESCPKLLRHFVGAGAPALAVTVYGNRDYDDALRELADLLREQGFALAGAAAVVAQHSIFPEVAAGRLTQPMPPSSGNLPLLPPKNCGWPPPRTNWGSSPFRATSPTANRPLFRYTPAPPRPASSAAPVHRSAPPGPSPWKTGGSPSGNCASPAPPASRPARWMPAALADRSMPLEANSLPTNALHPVSQNFSCDIAFFI